MQKYWPLALLVPFCLLGCSQKAAKVGLKAQESNGVRIYISSDPDPLQTGDNTLIVKLMDIATNEPVVNANVTVSAYNELAGGGDRESGRSQGDGQYNVPVKLGIPDSYRLDVQVQRPSQPDSDATFSVTSE
jgi:hypothetical protein